MLSYRRVYKQPGTNPYDKVLAVTSCHPLHVGYRTGSLYARHTLESVGLVKSKNCQKGWGSENLHYKRCLNKKGVAKIKKGGVAYPN